MAMAVCHILIFLNMILTASASSWWQNGLVTHSGISHRAREEASLISGSSELLSKATAILASLETAPSCHRTATTLLLGDCSKLNGTVLDPQKQLEDIRSRYAAALALCELQEAGASTPVACERLGSRQASDSAGLSTCLRSLKQEPQSWTSYSNNRKNAHILCAAARDDMEQDRSVHLFKSVTEAFESVRQALSDALRAAQQQTEKRMSFAQNVKDLEQATLSSLQVLKESRESMVAEAFDGLRLKVSGMLETLATQSQSANVQVEQIHSALKTINVNASQTLDTFRAISKLLFSDVYGSTQRQKSELLEAQTSAEDLHRSLELLKVDYGAPMLSRMEEMQNRLVASNLVQNSLVALQERLHERSLHLQDSFDRLDDRIAQISDRHAEQARIQHDLQSQTTRWINSSMLKLTRLDQQLDDFSARASNFFPGLLGLNDLAPAFQRIWSLKWLLLPLSMVIWEYRNLARRAFSIAFTSVLAMKVLRALFISTSPKELSDLPYGAIGLSHAQLVVCTGVAMLAIGFLVCTVENPLHRFRSTLGNRNAPAVEKFGHSVDAGVYRPAPRLTDNDIRQSKMQGSTLKSKLRASRAVSLGPGL